ncbi:MAG TPA: A/G-specific adenine glycosylase [Verrucomicrobiae bacterium]|nr:A/G-specific adenine glycosylase [Verrucomicrobiae bacterium]
MNRIQNNHRRKKNNPEYPVNPVPKTRRLVPLLLDWFAANARDLPWRRTRDAYAIWVSEIMLQQTQVKTVIPYWERWMRELPTIEAVAKASPAKIHKLWEGLGYYTRVRNLQKAAKLITQSGKRKAESGIFVCRFPQNHDDVLALPGIGPYTAGAICSIAFNQPTPILDGNVIRVLTRVFGIAENPKERKTTAQLWQIAEDLVSCAKGTKGKSPSQTSRPSHENNSCSHLNQSLMELGALVCTPRNPQCRICPVKKLCVAFLEDRADELPNFGKRKISTARRFFAFIIERNGKFLIRQRPAGVVNAYLWEFPNVEVNGANPKAGDVFKSQFGIPPLELAPMAVVKHSITCYRITLEAFRVRSKETSATFSNQPESGSEGATPRHTVSKTGGVWRTARQMRRLPFTAAHRRLFQTLMVATGR